MPSKEQFARVMQAKFAKVNGHNMPDAWLSWAYESFRMGYYKGQDEFMKTHDWYE